VYIKSCGSDLYCTNVHRGLNHNKEIGKNRLEFNLSIV
jgi:hypothetical protein